MSKASTARTKEKRKKDKFAKKQAKKALYESYKKQGINKKSKRYKKKIRNRKLVSGVSHPDGGLCGNPACMVCYRIHFNPFLDKHGIPEGMPQWMYQRWIKTR